MANRTLSVQEAVSDPGTERRTGLRAKLVRVYALQVLLISLAAVIGVYITYLIVEDVLSRQALVTEAEYFWERYRENPDHPLPHTANMIGYLSSGEEGEVVPEELLDREPGYGRVEALPGAPLVHISERDGQKLFLVFPREQVSELVFYFGLAPLLAVLLSVYVLLFITYRLSHRAISPLLNLARVLERFDFTSNERLEIPIQPRDVDEETRLMVEAFQEFGNRLDQFIERERTFTSNAGHELRTPIAVLKGSLEVMTQHDLPEQDRGVVERMQRVVGDMETLLETLLMLAREREVSSDDPVSLNQVVAEEIELLSELAEERGNSIVFEEEVEASVSVQPRVLAILVGNLLRNALQYTQDGKVTVRLTALYIAVTDTGIGMAPQELAASFDAFYRGAGAQQLNEGQGLGLALVRRLIDQLEWRIDVESEPGVGTEFRIWYGSST